MDNNVQTMYYRDTEEIKICYSMKSNLSDLSYLGYFSLICNLGNTNLVL